jgi:hypothetical protein
MNGLDGAAEPPRSPASLGAPAGGAAPTAVMALTSPPWTSTMGAPPATTQQPYGQPYGGHGGYGGHGPPGGHGGQGGFSTVPPQPQEQQHTQPYAWYDEPSPRSAQSAAPRQHPQLSVDTMGRGIAPPPPPPREHAGNMAAEGRLEHPHYQHPLDGRFPQQQQPLAGGRGGLPLPQSAAADVGAATAATAGPNPPTHCRRRRHPQTSS